MAKRENGSGTIIKRKYKHSTKYVAYGPAKYDTDENENVILIRDKIGTFLSQKDAREAITDYLLSAEGQKFMVEGYMHSVMKGFSEVPFDSVDTDGLIEKDMGVDWVRCYTMRDEIRTKFQEAVTIPEKK